MLYNGGTFSFARATAAVIVLSIVARTSSSVAGSKDLWKTGGNTNYYNYSAQQRIFKGDRKLYFGCNIESV